MGAASNVSCYVKNGSLSPAGSYPCSSDPSEDDPVQCCGTGGLCTDNKLCVIDAGSTLVAGDCTDQTWKSQNCPDFCPHDMGNPPLFDCGSGNYCCATMWKNCCGDSSAQVLRLGTSWKIIGSIGPSGFVPLSTTATTTTKSSAATGTTATTATTTRISTSTTSTTPTPTPDPTPAPTTSNAGAIAGGVVGGVAALGLLGLAIFLLRRRSKKRARKEEPGPGQDVTRRDGWRPDREMPKEMMATPASRPMYAEMGNNPRQVAEMAGEPRSYRPVELPN